MILKIQNFGEKKIPLYRREGSFFHRNFVIIFLKIQNFCEKKIPLYLEYFRVLYYII